MVLIDCLYPTDQLFVDSDKATKDMEAFAAANEARLYKLFKTCADPQTDLRTLVKARVSTQYRC